MLGAMIIFVKQKLTSPFALAYQDQSSMVIWAEAVPASQLRVMLLCEMLKASLCLWDDTKRCVLGNLC